MNLMSKEMARQSRGEFRAASDDWYPNWEGGLVKVNGPRQLSDGMWRVSVWGADDFGMERDVASQEQAEAIYRRIPVIISADILETLQFVRS